MSLQKCLHFRKNIFTFVKLKFKSMNRRLLQFLQAENITQSQLADILGVARGSISHILSGRNKPGYDFMESLLLHYPQLNLDWLLTGKGKMYKDPEKENPLPEESLFVPDMEDASISASGKPQISHIIVFYADNSFQEFHPAQ